MCVAVRPLTENLEHRQHHRAEHRNSFVTDEKGNLLIVYHARPANHASQGCGTYNKDPLYDPCRHTRIKRVCFDGNGTPVLNLSDDAEISPTNKTVTATVTVG